MDLLIGVVILLVLSVPWLFSIQRSNELFCLEVAGGTVKVRRGHVPPGLLADLTDVVRHGKPARAQLRVVKERGRARLVVRGKLPEALEQRLRNVVGTHSLVKIQDAQRRRS